MTDFSPATVEARIHAAATYDAYVKTERLIWELENPRTHSGKHAL